MVLAWIGVTSQRVLDGVTVLKPTEGQIFEGSLDIEYKLIWKEVDEANVPPPKYVSRYSTVGTQST